MIEIRIHGRGGQGNVVAAYLLASAAFEEGRRCQAFPNFGAERRGAPVVAFVRIAEQVIKRRCQVREPAFLIVQDASLLHIPGVLDGLKKGGGILVNAPRSSEELSKEYKLPMVALPGTQLANEFLGKPMPNVALLAAFLSLTEIVPHTALSKALTHRFKGDVLEKNLKLVEETSHRVPAGLWKDVAHAARA
ncbi:MAG: 2-oxoacid:acceptor oxidoreductase family protein [Rhodospirillales bacterium]|nr:2-oxoacid:acceptor oxidoreductase family protein [Rhodospirillales bacterium]